MPFSMTHLQIARNILHKTAKISNPSSFYLGTLAPDAVHYRPNYSSDFKKASHFCVGPGKWGEITNNEEWRGNVLSFFDSKKTSADSDFIYGYCIHILADIYNNINEWTPFRMKHPEELAKGYGNIHHFESGIVDLQQYQSYTHREEIWGFLETSEPINVPGAVSAEEIDKLKDDILNLRYKNKPAADSSGNRHVTFEGMQAFISAATDFAADSMAKCKC